MFGWLARFRRLSRDFERMPEVLAGLHFVVFVTLMLPKVAIPLTSGASSSHPLENIGTQACAAKQSISLDQQIIRAAFKSLRRESK